VLDPKVIRENPDAVKAGAIKKHFPDRVEAVDKFLGLDAAIRELIPTIDGLRSEQKTASKEMGKIMGTLSPEEREQFLAKQKTLKAELQGLEEKERQLKADRDETLSWIPNIPDEDVPEGKDDQFNVEVRTWGEITKPDFEVRPHYDLGEAQGWMDFQRAAQIAGSRNYFLMGDGAALQDAVLSYAVDHMVSKGFTLVDPPLLVRDESMRGTAFFPGGEEQTYRCEKDELNLIGTAEVPVTSIHSGEILSEDELPKLYVGRSYCFRREAGTYGKDTRGLYRVHQFQKVEQVIVDIGDVERSKEHHEFIVRNAEEVLQALELPYRVVVVCGGDLGAPQVKKYDIECWMPSRENYGETHSASRFHDYQARRLKLRYRRNENKKVAFCHTLNNTVLASPRILIPLLEIHQQADGTVAIPEPLVPYMGGRTTIGRAL
jgi:seryl-tRNA synthetase